MRALPPIEDLIVPGAVWPTTTTPERGLVRDRRALPPGRLYKDVHASAIAVHRTLRAVRARDPSALVCVNQEGGRLNTFDWPGEPVIPTAESLGRLDPGGIAMAATVLGRRLRSLLLNWNLAPVCDIAGTADAPAIGSRAFSSSAAVVERCVGEWVEAQQRTGVAATAKHFPGLGGTTTDPHAERSVNVVPLDDRLRPFEAAVQSGVAAVMTSSHVDVALDAMLPACLSTSAVRCLRDRVGFDGVIVSDSLTMSGLRPFGDPPELVAACLGSGHDIALLNPHVALAGGRDGDNLVAKSTQLARCLDAVDRAVGRGDVEVRSLERSLERVAAMRAAYSFSAPAGRIAREPSAADVTVLGQLARSATTVRLRTALHEVAPARRPLVARLRPVRYASADAAWRLPFHLGQHVASRWPSVPTVEVASSEELGTVAAALEADCVVACTYEAVLSGHGVLLPGYEGALIHVALGSTRDFLLSQHATAWIAAAGPDHISADAALCAVEDVLGWD